MRPTLLSNDLLGKSDVVARNPDVKFPALKFPVSIVTSPKLDALVYSLLPMLLNTSTEYVPAHLQSMDTLSRMGLGEIV